MRIDLERGNRRPFMLKWVVFPILRRWIGLVPPPQYFVTYRADLIGKTMMTYFLRCMSQRGAWSKGEAELFAAYVSDLNTCRF